MKDKLEFTCGRCGNKFVYEGRLELRSKFVFKAYDEWHKRHKDCPHPPICKIIGQKDYSNTHVLSSEEGSILWPVDDSQVFQSRSKSMLSPVDSNTADASKGDLK